MWKVCSDADHVNLFQKVFFQIVHLFDKCVDGYCLNGAVSVVNVKLYGPRTNFKQNQIEDFFYDINRRITMNDLSAKIRRVDSRKGAKPYDFYPRNLESFKFFKLGLNSHLFNNCPDTGFLPL